MVHTVALKNPDRLTERQHPILCLARFTGLLTTWSHAANLGLCSREMKAITAVFPHFDWPSDLLSWWPMLSHPETRILHGTLSDNLDTADVYPGLHSIRQRTAFCTNYTKLRKLSNLRKIHKLQKLCKLRNLRKLHDSRSLRKVHKLRKLHKLYTQITQTTQPPQITRTTQITQKLCRLRNLRNSHSAN